MAETKRTTGGSFEEKIHVLHNLLGTIYRPDKTGQQIVPCKPAFKVLLNTRRLLVYDYDSFKLKETVLNETQFPFDKLVLAATALRCQVVADQLAGTR